jgi:hypothetical protein
VAFVSALCSRDVQRQCQCQSQCQSQSQCQCQSQSQSQCQSQSQSQSQCQSKEGVVRREDLTDRGRVLGCTFLALNALNIA